MDQPDFAEHGCAALEEELRQHGRCDRFARADSGHHLGDGGGPGEPQFAVGGSGVNCCDSVAWGAAAAALSSGLFRGLHLSDRNPAGAREDGVGCFHGMAEIIGLEHFLAPLVAAVIRDRVLVQLFVVHC